MSKEYITLDELGDYVNNLNDDEILSVTFENTGKETDRIILGSNGADHERYE